MGRGARLAGSAAAVLAAAGALAGSAASREGFDGRYATTLAAGDLRLVGTPADIALADAGSWTLSVAGGRWSLRQTGGPFGDAYDRGDVVVTGPVARFTLRTSDGHPHHVYDGALRWTRRDAGIRFAIVGRQREDVAGVLAARPWLRIS